MLRIFEDTQQAVPVEFFSLYTGGDRRIILYHGDCFMGMKKLIEPESVDVIVTSPPYNIGIRYGRYDDSIPRNAYLNWMRRWGTLVRSVLKPDGSLFINVGSKPSDPWVPFEVAGVLRDNLILQNVIHWIKSIYIENSSYEEELSLNVGHFKPINSKRFLNDAHEYVFHFTKTGKVPLDRLAIGAPYKDGSNITRWKSAKNGIRCRGNNWYIPYQTIQRRATDRPHPASYPPELAEMCIKLHGMDRVELVLDPFLGIGNTAIACARLGVGMIGFEIDGEYLKEAKRLLENNDESVE
ncbi:site-specific DNA-methyltransferase [candidate division WOR-3 bacterium]|nr:site-specific DNA-methyltransferase [candidate division WOR-3 bacterium]